MIIEAATLISIFNQVREWLGLLNAQDVRNKTDYVEMDSKTDRRRSDWTRYRYFGSKRIVLGRLPLTVMGPTIRRTGGG